MIISDDTRLTEALRRYEGGDITMLKELMESGELRSRFSQGQLGSELDFLLGSVDMMPIPEGHGDAIIGWLVGNASHGATHGATNGVGGRGEEDARDSPFMDLRMCVCCRFSLQTWGSTVVVAPHRLLRSLRALPAAPCCHRRCHTLGPCGELRRPPRGAGARRRRRW